MKEMDSVFVRRSVELGRNYNIKMRAMFKHRGCQRMYCQAVQKQKFRMKFLSKPDGQCTYKRNIEARSRNHCCRGKAISITHSECLVRA
jgi:hypothetical protein